MEKKTSFDFDAGEIFLVNKPLTWTSFDVVKKLRYATRIKKIGHAGTLDPLATGLLIICVGRKATKQIADLQGLIKTYTGTFYLGATTPSYDGETAIDNNFDISHITTEALHQNCEQFSGWIDQLPPMFSAIKVDGKRLYKHARKGREIERKSRKVEIQSFTLNHIKLPEINFEVRCSKGTYIRSLAHDFGQALNNGAYLTALCRTSIGQHHLKDAWELEDLCETIYTFRKNNDVNTKPI